jgi:hypothetical protein
MSGQGSTPAPRGSNAPLVADDDALAAGAALDDTISDTTSIADSILAYRQENGRTYHAFKDGSYVLPNDKVCDFSKVPCGFMLYSVLTPD